MEVLEQFVRAGENWLRALGDLSKNTGERMQQIASTGSLVRMTDASEYRVYEKIGQGSFGIVFRAVLDNQEVAIKVVSEVASQCYGLANNPRDSLPGMCG
jgi:serine/threonine protein kinase